MSIYEELIPEPPQVHITGKIAVTDGILLQWTAKPEPPTGLWYIVQFEDQRGVWRGVAPRSSKSELLLPQKRFAGRRLSVRVLASSGIATGRTDDIIEFPRPTTRAKPMIALIGSTSPDVSRILRASVLHDTGTTRTLAWFDEHGAELSQGSALDTGRLADGESLVCAVALGTDMLQHKSWLVTKKAGSVVSVRELPERTPDEPHIHPHPKRR